MFIYYAGPLFSQAERDFNQGLVSKLESLGFRVFLPQRDGVEKTKLQYQKTSSLERRWLLFSLDIKKIEQADIFLLVLDGRVPDEGACVELGIAYSLKKFLKQKKLIVGLQTDSRAAFLGTKLNPMLAGCFDCLAKNEKQLISCLRELKA
jgi:nucleoside 2-deoxyribosyltransferase